MTGGPLSLAGGVVSGAEIAAAPCFLHLLLCTCLSASREGCKWQQTCSPLLFGHGPLILCSVSTNNSTIKGTSISPLSAKDRSFKQIINMETLDLNYTLEHIGLTDIHRTFHPKTAEYTICSSPHGIISRIGHILGHKTSLNKF